VSLWHLVATGIHANGWNVAQALAWKVNANARKGWKARAAESLSLISFLGGFDLEEACTAGSDAYPVDIKRWGTSNLELAIVGLWEQQDSLRATIHEDGTTFEILRQTIGGQDILGNGQINVNGDEINLEYEVISTTASSPFDHCTATLKKQ
jgi:hypothetical protein